jgi:hypothetical protein
VPRLARRALRDAAANLALGLASALLTYGACEVVAAKLFLDRTPLNRQEFLSNALRVLAQSSKRGITPRPGFIALAGDSYAAGAGDWLLETDPGSNAPFHSAHVLYQRTGRDVISFGYSAWGSLDGFATGPRWLRACLNRLWLFGVPEPGWVLLYFYEGNDLDDNVRDIRTRYLGHYDTARMRDPEYFGRFIEDESKEACGRCRLADNLVFARLFARKAGQGLSAPEGGPQDLPATAVASGQARANAVLIDGRRVAIPSGLQSPALDLTDGERDLALYVLEQSVRAARATFARSRVALVYIPSPLSSYAIASDRVSIQTYEPGAPDECPMGLVSAGSDAIATAVAGICSRNGLEFIDARPAVRRATGHELLHGPRDWKHFNRRGYTVLAETIVREWRDSRLAPSARRPRLPARGSAQARKGS